jgi:hypothetical protein
MAAVLATRHVTADIPWTNYRLMFATFFKYSILNYSIISGAVFVIGRQRAARYTELVRARLERELSKARVESILVDLQPKRVLDALDGVAARLPANPAGAEADILALSQSLREKLSHRIGSSSRRILAAAANRVRDARPLRVTWLLPLAFPLFSVYAAVLYVLHAVFVQERTQIHEELKMVVSFTTASFLWPLVLWTCRRFPAAGPSWRRNAVLVGLSCVTVALLVEVAIVLLRGFAMGRPAGETFGPVLLIAVMTAYLLHNEEFGRRELREQLRAQELARAVTNARLSSLRTQIAPHFLFNVLNSIVTLIRRDAMAAAQMLERLRRILHLTLVADARQMVQLREDLELTASYIEIERIRYRDALDVTVAIDDTLLDAAVPAFLLQPLVENAIRHGALSSLDRGRIRLSVARDAGSMEISVENDCELVDPALWREGIGLSNVRARLDHLYRGSHGVRIEPLQGRGVAVRIRLPVEGEP